MIRKIARKVLRFSRFPKAVKLLFVEALFTSLWVKISLKFFPFKRVLTWQGAVNKESDRNPQPDTLFIRKNIKTALQLCNRYSLWPTECYTLSLTGKLLLRRRNISSTIYIGFKKDEGKYKGHAWLRANDIYISGFKESKEFQVTLLFS